MSPTPNARPGTSSAASRRSDSGAACVRSWTRPHSSTTRYWCREAAADSTSSSHPTIWWPRRTPRLHRSRADVGGSVEGETCRREGSTVVDLRRQTERLDRVQQLGRVLVIFWCDLREIVELDVDRIDSILAVGHGILIRIGAAADT